FYKKPQLSFSSGDLRVVTAIFTKMLCSQVPTDLYYHIRHMYRRCRRFTKGATLERNTSSWIIRGPLEPTAQANPPLLRPRMPTTNPSTIATTNTNTTTKKTAANTHPLSARLCTPPRLWNP